MFIEKLRSETKHIHQALEKAMIPDLKKATTLEAYAKILRTFYGYFKGLEPLLDAQLDNTVIPAYDARRKSHVILEDLHAMKLDTTPLPPVADQLPHVTNVHEALGALYVLEGSTLGGRVITNMLMQNLNLHDTTYVKFFNGYGEQTEAMWGSFMGALNKYTADEKTHATVIQAATDTFAYFKNWVEKNQSASWAGS